MFFLTFFLSIQLLGESLGAISKDFAEQIVVAVSNPSIGLFIGLLSTAVLQSSSTTTSIAVAAVAAGSVSLQNAIPIIMGANVGTTLTSTLVSLSYVTKSSEFKKAVSAGSIHDIFNLLTVIIIFPLEMNYGILTNLSQSMASLVNINEGGTPVAETFLVYRLFNETASWLISWFGPYVVLILALVLLFATVKYISNILYKKLVGRVKDQFHSVIFNNTFKSFGWGFLMTGIIQSSSLTTSLIVPLAATGQVKLKRAFQFIMGANLGTTITALLASMFKSEAAISLAFAHLLFNLFGVLVFMGIPYLRKLPLFLADKLGTVSLRYRLTAFAYILVVFFIMPFTLIYFSKSSNLTAYQDDKSHSAISLNK